MLPHPSKVLIHRHVLLWNLLRRAFTSVVFAVHEVWIGSTRKGKKTTTEFARAKKCKGTGAVASIDVFEAEALGQYL